VELNRKKDPYCFTIFAIIIEILNIKIEMRSVRSNADPAMLVSLSATINTCEMIGNREDIQRKSCFRAPFFLYVPLLPLLPFLSFLLHFSFYLLTSIINGVLRSCIVMYNVELVIKFCNVHMEHLTIKIPLKLGNF